VQQFVEEGHLRWDSLGEFLALVASLEHLADAYGDEHARVLAAALDRANARYLNDDRSPSRRVHEIDNRGSHAWLARYWAEELAAQDADAALAARFTPLARELAAAWTTIEQELADAQGAPVDLGGYYRPDPVKVAAAMRPSATFTRILDGVAD
jgi:isocitrate dehydrogenase